jgi:hypothetical protein
VEIWLPSPDARIALAVGLTTGSGQCHSTEMSGRSSMSRDIKRHKADR